MKWFRQTKWYPMPLTWQGWLVVGIATLVCLVVFDVADRYSQSLVDTLAAVYPYWISTGVAAYFIASRTS